MIKRLSLAQGASPAPAEFPCEATHRKNAPFHKMIVKANNAAHDWAALFAVKK
jgi:hypothetical protein